MSGPVVMLAVFVIDSLSSSVAIPVLSIEEMETWSPPRCRKFEQYSQRKAYQQRKIKYISCLCEENCYFDMDNTWKELVKPDTSGPNVTEHIIFNFTCTAGTSVYWNNTSPQRLDDQGLFYCHIVAPLNRTVFAEGTVMLGMNMIENTVERRQQLFHGWVANNTIIVKNQEFLPDVDMIDSGGLLPTRRYMLLGNVLQKVPQLATLKTVLILTLNLNNLTEQSLLTHNDTYNCETLTLNRNLFQDLSSYTFNGTTKYLFIQHGKLSVIADNTFSGLRDLEELHLDNNLLTSIPINLFQNLQQLTAVTLADNKLGTNSFDAKLFSSVKNLKSLNLRNNGITHLPRKLFDGLDNLISLVLSENKLKEIPLEAYVLPKLSSLDLSYNEIDEKSFSTVIRELEKTQLKLDSKRNFNLENNVYTIFPSQELDNNGLISRFRQTLRYVFYQLGNNSYSCQCKKSYEFYNYMHNFLHSSTIVWKSITYSEDIKCASPPYLKSRTLFNLDKSEILCPITGDQQCPPQCQCFKRMYDDSILVNCTDRSMTGLPKHVPLHTSELHLANNKIKHLTTPQYLQEITVLNLDQNDISEIPVDFLKSIPKMKELKLAYNQIKYFPDEIETMHALNWSIHHNPIACNCYSLWFKRWVSTNRKRVDDLHDIVCFSGEAGGIAILEASDHLFLCVDIILASTIVPAGILAIAIILGCIFKKEIKVIVYHKFSWHPLDKLHEDETLTYDAFVSYCSDDEHWIVTQLAKKLESANPPYKLCLHYKHFEPGVAIADNIVTSIDSSKRTILVLSNSFLESEWCRYEFQAAHYRALKNRRKYLIIIMLNKIDNSKLDKNLRLYLKTNGYIKPTERLFWEKLKYELPTKSIEPTPVPTAPSAKTIYPTGVYINTNHEYDNKTFDDPSDIKRNKNIYTVEDWSEDGTKNNKTKVDTSKENLNLLSIKS